MKKEKQILEEVEKTLQSFDNDLILKENPFLLTRIIAEREKRLGKRKKAIFLKTALNQVLVILILLINLVTMVYYFEKKTEQDTHERLVMELREDFQIDQSQNIF